MNPTELKDFIEACVQALSDDRVSVGAYPIMFQFGTASDAFLSNIKDREVNTLAGGGIVLMEFVRFAEVKVDEETNSQTYPIKLIISKTHRPDEKSVDNLPLITEMFNVSTDLVAKMKAEVTTNLSDTNIALAKKTGVIRTGWSPFDHAPNITGGVTVNLEITTKYCPT